MFETYEGIFQKRGHLYHQAMTRYPMARANEFRRIVQLAALQQGQWVCDIPSGGGYLMNFIHIDVHLFSLETSSAFARNCAHLSRNAAALLTSMDGIPLKSESVQCVISLAGLHHVVNKPSVYREAYRLLENGGVFCLADVWHGSAVARFLNGFVHAHSSMGHAGIFLDDRIEQDLKATGFDLSFASVLAYPWAFDTLQDMIVFCRMLFGIDRAADEDILTGIETYLGWSKTGEQYGMNWDLLFCRSVRS